MNRRQTVASLIVLLFGALQANAQGKMSLDVTKTVIGLFRSGTRTEEQTVKIIESRGVDFLSTENNLAELSGAGASLAILGTIRRIAPVPSGGLDVRCAPAE